MTFEQSTCDISWSKNCFYVVSRNPGGHMKFSHYLLLGLLVACGGRTHNSASDSPQPQNEEPSPTTVNLTVYKANLRPVNNRIAASASGSATITITEDNFMVALFARDLPNANHMQHVHLLSHCPTIASDANSDGYVDAMEARAVTGAGFIPLDSDLDTQEDGSGNNPSGSAYTYNETASLSRLLADLRQPELDSDNSVVRLGAGGNLNLANRVIVIHGADPAAVLPGTVASYNGIPAQDTLPVLCGELSRVISQ